MPTRGLATVSRTMDPWTIDNEVARAAIMIEELPLTGTRSGETVGTIVFANSGTDPPAGERTTSQHGCEMVTTIE